MERYNQGRREFLKLVGIGGGVLSGLVHLPLAFAKDVYPAERITWVVATKAGGAFDLIARVSGPYLTRYLKESSKGAKGGEIMIKNVPEAGGKRAYNNIFHANSDGYTIGDFNTAFITDTITDKIEFDCNKFTFLLRTAASLRLILTHKKGFKNWNEMMKAGKEKELKWAASNFGRGHHVACILVKEAAKVPARLINFPGAAENANALVRGDVDIAIMAEESAKPMIDAGEFRALTVLSKTSPYPGVPSIAELGYPELADTLKVHRMIVAPPDLPTEVTNILLSGFKKLFANKEFLAQAKKMDFTPDPLYGADAERMAKSLFKYIDEKTPILKKYLM